VYRRARSLNIWFKASAALMANTGAANSPPTMTEILAWLKPWKPEISRLRAQ
jgi:hypothetical protein